MHRGSELGQSGTEVGPVLHIIVALDSRVVLVEFLRSAV